MTQGDKERHEIFDGRSVHAGDNSRIVVEVTKNDNIRVTIRGNSCGERSILLDDEAAARLALAILSEYGVTISVPIEHRGEVR